MFDHPDLHHENNYVCPHCNSILWKEERKHRLDCCNSAKYTILPLQPVSPELVNIFSNKKFRRAQRRYSGLVSFTAIGAGGIQKRTWTEPPKGKSMLCLHGKAHHRIFDLQQLGNKNVRRKVFFSKLT